MFFFFFLLLPYITFICGMGSRSLGPHLGKQEGFGYEFGGFVIYLDEPQDNQVFCQRN
jgi:hypothetical protein